MSSRNCNTRPPEELAAKEQRRRLRQLLTRLGIPWYRREGRTQFGPVPDDKMEELCQELGKILGMSTEEMMDHLAENYRVIDVPA
jgi:hypothetical protein